MELTVWAKQQLFISMAHTLCFRAKFSRLDLKTLSCSLIWPTRSFSVSSPRFLYWSWRCNWTSMVILLRWRPWLNNVLDRKCFHYFCTQKTKYLYFDEIITISQHHHSFLRVSQTLAHSGLFVTYLRNSRRLQSRYSWPPPHSESGFKHSMKRSIWFVFCSGGYTR